MNSETIIRELVDEHGITGVVLVCPCACDANSLNGKPKADCEYCNGNGKVQYGIDEVVFFV